MLRPATRHGRALLSCPAAGGLVDEDVAVARGARETKHSECEKNRKRVVGMSQPSASAPGVYGRRSWRRSNYGSGGEGRVGGGPRGTAGQLARLAAV